MLDDHFVNAEKSLQIDNLKVCVIGIGRIGLPTALSFAKSGISTIGLDINQKLIDRINNNDFPLKDEPGYQNIFNHVMEKKLFHATSNTKEAISSSNIILLSLPTPMDDANIPNYDAILSVGKNINQYVSPNTIIIVESTVEPGFIENEFSKIILSNNEDLRIGENIGIGVCPETANPGEILKDFTNLPRLVAAFDNKTVKIITSLYKHVFDVELIEMSNCKTANAVKLTTNVFRDVNIAFINELSILFEKIGINAFEVINAAKSKYNFQAHYPGIGVGGPCLPVNSYQFLNTSKFNKNLLRIVRIGREINEHMPQHTVELLLDGLNEANKSTDNLTVLILGVSYKPNVKDIQISPAEPLIKKLLDLKINVKIYDPYFKNTTVYGLPTESNLDVALAKTDAVILATAHNEFHDLDHKLFNRKNLVFVDSCNTMNIDDAKKYGIIYRGIGRGIN